MPDVIFNGMLESYFRYRYTAIDPLGNKVPYSGVFSITGSLGHGSDPGQSRVLYVGSGIIPVSDSVNLDLVGPLEDMFGNDLTFEGITLLMVKNNSPINNPSPPTIELDSTATNGIVSFYTGPPGKLRLPAGSSMMLFNPRSPYQVSADSEDILRLSNIGESTAAYQILIAGI
ncbi:MAG: hypothetical protein QXT45_05875 [Candidatus Bilamarchaeaceae archaeon]